MPAIRAEQRTAGCADTQTAVERAADHDAFESDVLPRPSGSESTPPSAEKSADGRFDERESGERDERCNQRAHVDRRDAT